MRWGTVAGNGKIKGGDALVAEYDGSGTLLRRYIHGPGAGVDDPLAAYEGATFASGALRYLFADRQGSITLAGDSAGNAIRLFAYDEYGMPQAGDGAALTAANGARFGYTGQAWLPDVGMYYYKARIYSPTLGRFLQTDPIGYNDQINLYAYVANDPIDGRDPSGNDAVWINNPDGTKTLVIPVQFGGSGATPANVSAIVARDNSLSISDPSLKIKVVSTSSPIKGVLNKMDFSPGYNNKMCGSAGECVNKLGGDTAHINSANNQGTDVAAHDVLHFAGIKDQYTEGPRDAQGNRTSTSNPDYGNTNIMTSRRGTELKPQQFQEAKGNPSTKQCTVTKDTPC